MWLFNFWPKNFTSCKIPCCLFMGLPLQNHNSTTIYHQWYLENLPRNIEFILRSVTLLHLHVCCKWPAYQHIKKFPLGNSSGLRPTHVGQLLLEHPLFPPTCTPLSEIAAAILVLVTVGLLSSNIMKTFTYSSLNHRSVLSVMGTVLPIQMWLW